MSKDREEAPEGERREAVSARRGGRGVEKGVRGDRDVVVWRAVSI